MSAVRTTTRLAVAALGLAVLFVVAAPQASAQEDPYGSTTTTTPTNGRGDIEATCGLNVSEGRPGDTVTATVNGVFFGESVSIFFDSLRVATAVAPEAVVAQSAGGAVAFNGAALPAQQATTSVTLTFTVPNAAVGIHTVTAVGDTFTCFCNPDGAFRILAAKAGKGVIPRTGVYIALFLVAAIALLVVGRGFVVAARRRRAAALAAEAEASADEDEHSLLSPRR